MVANLGKARNGEVRGLSDLGDDLPEVEEMTPVHLPDPVLIGNSAVEPGSRDVVPNDFPIGPLLEGRLREYARQGSQERRASPDDPSYRSLAGRIAKIVQMHFTAEIRQRNKGFLLVSRLEECEDAGKVKLKHTSSVDMEPPKSDTDDGIQRTIDRLVGGGNKPGVIKLAHPIFEVEPNEENKDLKDLPFFDFSVEMSELPSAGGFNARVECSAAYSDADDTGLRGAFRYTRHFFALKKVVREVFEAYGMPLRADSVLEQTIAYLRLQNLSEEDNHRLPPKGAYGETAYSLVVEMNMRPSEVNVTFQDQTGFAQKAVDTARRESAMLKYASPAKHKLARVGQFPQGKLEPDDADDFEDDFEIARYEEPIFETVGKEKRDVKIDNFYVSFSKKR